MEVDGILGEEQLDESGVNWTLFLPRNKSLLEGHRTLCP
jgi:hypothetical protein